ncbi:hypothetical protein HK405_000775, partial [Cladochytrium tenue]
ASEDGKSVRRRRRRRRLGYSDSNGDGDAVGSNGDPPLDEDRTLYVERLPPDATLGAVAARFARLAVAGLKRRGGGGDGGPLMTVVALAPYSPGSAAVVNLGVGGGGDDDGGGRGGGDSGVRARGYAFVELGGAVEAAAVAQEEAARLGAGFAMELPTGGAAEAVDAVRRRVEAATVAAETGGAAARNVDVGGGAMEVQDEEEDKKEVAPSNVGEVDEGKQGAPSAAEAEWRVEWRRRMDEYAHLAEQRRAELSALMRRRVGTHAPARFERGVVVAFAGVRTDTDRKTIK